MTLYDDHELPVAQSPRGTRHAVWGAIGTRADGSLYGFFTLCGYHIGPEPQWTEPEGATATCGNCKRIMAGKTFAGITKGAQ